MLDQYNIAIFANSQKGLVSIKTIRDLKLYKKLFIFTQKEDAWEPSYVRQYKKFASKNIKVFVLKNFTYSEFEKNIKKENIDLIFAIGWRKIIEKKIYRYPTIKSFVIHDSLLPKNRGFAPLNWSLIKGEKVTGASLISMKNKVDSGNIYLQKKIKINNSDNIKDLHNKILKIYKILLENFFRNINIVLKKSKSQKKLKYTFNKKRKPKDGLINWRNNAIQIKNLIRALQRPWPGAYLVNKNKIIFVWKIKILTKRAMFKKYKIGELIKYKSKLFCNCRNRLIKIENFTEKTINNLIKKTYEL